MAHRTSRMTGLATPRPALRTSTVTRLRPPPAFPAPALPLAGAADRARAAADFAVAAAVAVLTVPVMLACVLLVRLTSRGPAIYTQSRVGQGGRVFTLYKIRTMYHDCERQSGPRWSTPGDTRITPVGRVLRKLHLDELPQLWNVLRGDMSLIGPRPERPEFVPQLERAIPHYRDRLLVRPGVTGLAQVQLPADTDLDSVRRKLAYDLYYIRTFGLWLDIRLMLSTGLHMFGVPYSWLTVLFGIPSRETIEAAFPKKP
jgi:lipopolysaccharide/colanic/teichoic acid biosynthesis glycosyltransferase